MPPARTVLEESRSNLLAGPALLCGLCVLVVGSIVIRGIPHDASTRAATLVFAVGGVASVFLLLRVRRCRLATLAIDEHAIVMTPRGKRPEPRTIVRRPDSQLHIEISSDGTASPTSHSWYILYDSACDEPRIPIDIYGVDRVADACHLHHCLHHWPLRGRS